MRDRFCNQGWTLYLRRVPQHDEINQEVSPHGIGQGLT